MELWGLQRQKNDIDENDTTRVEMPWEYLSRVKTANKTLVVALGQEAARNLKIKVGKEISRLFFFFTLCNLKKKKRKKKIKKKKTKKT